MSPAALQQQDYRLQAESEFKLASVFDQFRPQVDELNRRWSSYLAQMRAFNRQTLQEIEGDPARAAVTRREFVTMLRSEQQENLRMVQELDKAMRSVDRRFSVYSHPATSAMARGLAATGLPEPREEEEAHRAYEEATGRPAPGRALPEPAGAIRADEAEPSTAEKVGSVLFAGADAAVQAVTAVAVPVTRYLHKAVEYGLEGILGEDAVRRIQEYTGWDPELIQVPVDTVLDERGRPMTVHGRIGVPELVGGLGAAVLGEQAVQFAGNVRDAQRLREQLLDRNGRFWGVASDVSTFVGSIAGLGGGTAPLMGALLRAKSAIASGLAMVGLQASKRTAAIANVVGTLAADVAANGTYEAIAFGSHDQYVDSFLRGANVGLAMHALGAMGGRLERLLLRKNMPSFLSQQLGAALTGAGMATYGVILPDAVRPLFGESPEGSHLWRFLKDPTAENWRAYTDEMTVSMLGMMAFKGAFGRGASREQFLRAMAERGDLDVLRGAEWSKEGKRIRTMGKTVFTLEELAKDEALQRQIGFSEYAEGLRPIVQELRREAKVQERIRPRLGELQPRGIPGSITGAAGVRRLPGGLVQLDQPENVVSSLMRWNRTHAARAATLREKVGEGVEIGFAGVSVGGKFVGVPFRGMRGVPGKEAQFGPRVFMDPDVRLVEALRAEGLTDAEIERRFEDRNLLFIHTHPNMTPPSVQDLAFQQAVARSGMGAHLQPHLVIGAESAWAILPKPKSTVEDAGRAIGAGDQEAAWTVRDQVVRELAVSFVDPSRTPKDLRGIEALNQLDQEILRQLATDELAIARQDLADAGKAVDENVALKRMSDEVLRQAFEAGTLNVRGDKLTREQQALVRLIDQVAYGTALQRRFGDLFDVRYLTAESAEAAFAEYAKTGDASVLGGFEAPGQQAPEQLDPIRQKIRAEFGFTPRQTVDRYSLESLGESMKRKLSAMREPDNKVMSEWLRTGKAVVPEAARVLEQAAFHEFNPIIRSAFGPQFAIRFRYTPQNLKAMADILGIDYGPSQFSERGPILAAKLPTHRGEREDVAALRRQQEQAMEEYRRKTAGGILARGRVRKFDREQVVQEQRAASPWEPKELQIAFAKKFSSDDTAILREFFSGLDRSDRIQAVTAALEWARVRNDEPFEFTPPKDLGGTIGIKFEQPLVMNQVTVDLAQRVLDALYGAYAPILPKASSAAAMETRSFDPGETEPQPDNVLAQERRIEEQMLKAVKPVPPPDEATSKAILDRMYGAESELTRPGDPTFQRLKAFAGKVGGAVWDFFTDRKFRLEIADLIERAGYRSRFRRVGEFEEVALAETDRVRKNIIEAPRLAMGDLSHVYEPIWKLEASPEERAELLRGLQEYASLRDVVANYVRQREVEGKLEDYTVRLPFDIPIEHFQKRLASLEDRLTPEQREAYSRMRAALDEAFRSMVVRGLASREKHFQKDYYPRRVFDWADVFDAIGPIRRTSEREPFRGYLRARQGSDRGLDVRLEALHSYLTKVRVDNEIHDYLHRLGEQVQDAVLDREGLTLDQIEQMSAADWRKTYDALMEKGMVVIDVSRGRVGEQVLEREPWAQAVMGEIAKDTGRWVPEVTLGYAFRPSIEEGRFVVPKSVLELMRESRVQSQWYRSPVLNAARRLVGKWFKGPALRGLGGIGLPKRIVRNLFSDATGVMLKAGEEGAASGAQALNETLKQFPTAHRIVDALSQRDWKKRLLQLSPEEQSLAAEFQYFGTGKSGIWTSETEYIREQQEGQFLRRFVPETQAWLDRVSQWARADFEWAQRLDDYAENLLRMAFFLRERFRRYQDLDLTADVAQNADRLAAVRAAHVRTGEVFVNYQWLTPGERMAVNGLLIPFYTWAKGNFTRSVAELLRHPKSTLSSYAAMSSIPLLWNWTMAKDEEERLLSIRPDLAGKLHLWVPGVRDEFGNPLLVYFEDTLSESLDFLGLNGFLVGTGAFAVGHQDADKWLRDSLLGSWDGARKAVRDWIAPWLRQVADVGYRSRFETVGERAENVSEALGAGFRPAADVDRLLGLSEDRSTAEKLMQPVPFVGFVDLTGGVPLAQAGAQFEAGRVQRGAARFTVTVEDAKQRFYRGLTTGDVSQMARAVDRVWASIEDNPPLGITKAHVWARLLKAAERQMKLKATERVLPPKWHELSRSQKVDLLMRMNR